MALPPVRLDPFQNIVNVSWSDGAGPGGGLSPAIVGVRERWQSSSFTGPSFTGAAPSSTNPGDLLLAHVSVIADWAIGGPAGWAPIYNLTDGDGSPIEWTGSLWWKLFQSGDPLEWDWSISGEGEERAVAATLIRIIGHRSTGIPDAFGLNARSDSAPSITPSVSNTLLLQFVTSRGNFNNIAWVDNDQIGVEYTEALVSFGPHLVQASFQENWSDPVATGTRLLNQIGRVGIIGHIAIAPSA